MHFIKTGLNMHLKRHDAYFLINNMVFIFVSVFNAYFCASFEIYPDNCHHMLFWFLRIYCRGGFVPIAYLTPIRIYRNYV